MEKKTDQINEALANSNDAGGMVDIPEALSNRPVLGPEPLPETDPDPIEEHESGDWQSCNSLRWRLGCTKSDLFYAAREGNQISGRTIEKKTVKDSNGNKTNLFRTYEPNQESD